MSGYDAMARAVGALTLRHYSRSPIPAVEDRDQVQVAGDVYHKPRGLWVSVEDGWGWREWCEAEDFCFAWEHAYRVELAPDANVLHLATPGDIDTFTGRFGRPVRFGLGIDWWAVAREYDGIIIAPYQWQRRLSEHATWYYPWDCSSGCIWRARAVASLTRTEAVA